MNDDKRVVYGPKILAKNPKPQTIVLLIKHPKTLNPRHFASNKSTHQFQIFIVELMHM